MVIGLPIGLTAGYVSGHVDLVLMRGIDLLLSFPALLLAIVLLTILGAGEGVTILAIGVIFMPIIARVTRSAVVVVRGMPYISGSWPPRGASHVRVLVGHVIPNSLAPVIVQASVLTGFAILIEASLAFLSLGVQPPTPDLGAILNEGGNFAAQAPSIKGRGRRGLSPHHPCLQPDRPRVAKRSGRAGRVVRGDRARRVCARRVCARGP